jgi:hypothetical protein
MLHREKSGNWLKLTPQREPDYGWLGSKLEEKKELLTSIEAVTFYLIQG